MKFQLALALVSFFIIYRFLKITETKMTGKI